MNEKIDALLSLNLTHLYWTREKVKAVGGAFDAYVIRNKHTGEPITAISELTEGAEMYAELFSQAPEMLADLRRLLMAAKKARDEKENHIEKEKEYDGDPRGLILLNCDPEQYEREEKTPN